MQYRNGLGDTADPRTRAYRMEADIRARGVAEQNRRAALSPEQRSAEDKQKADLMQAIQNQKNRTMLYNRIDTATVNVNELKKNPALFDEIEKFRELALANYWPTFFAYVPAKDIQNFTKFRFTWGPDGKPRFVPMTLASWMNFFGHADRTKWVRSKSKYVCPPKWENKHAHDKFKYDADSARKNKNTIPAHVRAWNPNDFICKKPSESFLSKLGKVVLVAAAVVAAVYLGPAALTAIQNGASALTGGLIPAAGGGTAAGATGAAGAAAGSSGAAAATTGSKVLQGAKTLVGYVNKANTIKAIAKGELPPPPIGIGGASFGQWATIVAKQKIKEEAMDAAMSAGTKYIEKKMTAKEERELQKEIADMQRQLVAMTPKEVLKTPPMPDPELNSTIKKFQQIEVKRADDLEKFIVPGAIVAGALLLGV